VGFHDLPGLQEIPSLTQGSGGKIGIQEGLERSVPKGFRSGPVVDQHKIPARGFPDSDHDFGLVLRSARELDNRLQGVLQSLLHRHGIEPHENARRRGEAPEDRNVGKFG